MSQCLIITGMHRSGTSFLASFLNAAGIDIGSDLFPADYYNPRGYFEDNAFLELDTEILHAGYPTGTSGFRDWGWAEDERLDRSRQGEFRHRATEIVARRSAAADLWGWKDPRTSLLLDFWDDVVDDARFAFVFRSPWEVMSSVARLGGTFFEARPDRGLAAWRFYNQHLLAFYRQHSDRCVLLPIEALSAEPQALLDRLATKLGIQPARHREGRELLSRLAEPQLLTRLEGSHTLPALLMRLYPAEGQLWVELEEAADLVAFRPAQEASVSSDALAADPAPPTDLTVVVRSRDQGSRLLEAVASARSLQPTCTAIVVDEASREPYTLHLLGRLPAAGVPVVRPEREGRSAALNAGIAAAHTPLVLTADYPAAIRPRYVARALALFAANDRIGVVCGGSDDPREHLPDDQPAELAAAFPGAGGAGVAGPALRRTTWEACGGYDEGLEAGFEHWDLLLAAAERGWLVAQVAEAVVGPPRSATVQPEASPSPLDFRLLLERVVARHPLLVDTRLPGLLVASEVERLNDEERQLAQKWPRQEPSAAMGARLQAAESEARELRAKLQEALAELERWAARVAFMEGTRAWRWRGRALTLRRLLRGRGGPGSPPR